jgi:hypothetical protein
MKARFKFGLIVGVVGLVLNVCVSGFVGLCGPLVALIAGAVAGLLAAQQERAGSKSAGAQLGAVAGVVAGGLVLIGQVLGGLAALLFFQFSGTETFIGQAPALGGDAAELFGYYLGGLGAGVCFGLVGVVVGALAGTGAGYLATPAQENIQL